MHIMIRPYYILYYFYSCIIMYVLLFIKFITSKLLYYITVKFIHLTQKIYFFKMKKLYHTKYFIAQPFNLKLLD